MKSNLIITYKHKELDMEGQSVNHTGSWRGGKFAKRVNDVPRMTLRPERESFHNVSLDAAERIVSKRNKKNIRFAKWYCKERLNPVTIYEEPKETL